MTNLNKTTSPSSELGRELYPWEEGCTVKLEDSHTVPDGVPIKFAGLVGEDGSDLNSRIIGDAWTRLSSVALDEELEDCSEGWPIAKQAAVSGLAYDDAELTYDCEWTKSALGLRDAPDDLARAAHAALVHVITAFPRGVDHYRAVISALAIFVHQLPSLKHLLADSEISANAKCSYERFTVKRALLGSFEQNGKDLALSTTSDFQEWWDEQLQEYCESRAAERHLNFAQCFAGAWEKIGLQEPKEITNRLLGLNNLNNVTTNAIQGTLFALSQRNEMPLDSELALDAMLIFCMRHPALRSRFPKAFQVKPGAQYLPTEKPRA